MSQFKIAGGHRPLLSKLAGTEGRVLLPRGEGGAKRRMRVYTRAILRPSPGASRHPLPEGEGHLRNRSAYAWLFRSPRWHWIYAGHNFVIWTDVVYDRRLEIGHFSRNAGFSPRCAQESVHACS